MRTDKEALALKTLNLIANWSQSLHESHDLMVSDLQDMQNLEEELQQTFDLAQKGRYQEGKAYPSWNSYVFSESENALKNMKDKENE